MIAFYYDNKSAIDESIRAAEALAESLRSQYPSLLQEKIKALGNVRADSSSSRWLLLLIAHGIGVWQNEGVCCPEDFDMVTLADALEVVEQLTEEDREILVDIVRNRQIERRRDEIVRDAEATLAEYREGKLKSMTAAEAIALLRADLDSPDEL